MAHPTRTIHDWKTITAPYTQAFAYTSDDQIEFNGFAAPGGSKGASVWAIKKFIYDSNSQLEDIQWAGGVFGFNFEWDDRATLSYS